MTELQQPNRRYKVGRVLSDYGLEDLHDRLSALWLGESGEEMSLRELADTINARLVQTALEQAGEDPLEGEAENTYRLLTDDDVSVGMRTQQRNRLQRAGIDVDQLEDDFVTHQAVYTYLRKALDVSKETEDTDRLEKHEERIQRLRSRLDAVVDQSLAELQSAGDLTGGEFETIISLQVYCQECNTQYELPELFEQGGCDCKDSD